MRATGEAAMVQKYIPPYSEPASIGGGSKCTQTTTAPADPVRAPEAA